MLGRHIVRTAALLIWGALLFAPFLFQDARALEVAEARGPSFWVERDVGRKAQWELCRRVGELGLRLDAVAVCGPPPRVHCGLPPRLKPAMK